MVGSKKWEVFGLKHVQRRDVREQRRDVLDSKVSNAATLRFNAATFQRVVKINVATLGSNVATFQRRAKPTSRR